jgi:putative transposase
MKTIHKAYKFRLKATTEQSTKFAQIAGVCRLTWNLCLAQRVLEYSSHKRSLNSYQLDPEITQLRKEYDWVKDVPSQVLQQANRNLDQAYTNFFKGIADFPEFKKKGKSKDSFRFPQGFQIDNGRVFLPKIGWIGFFKSQRIKGIPKHVTVSRNGKHWFVSICCEVEIADVAPKASDIGIDMGIVKLCAMSNGTVIENPDCFKKS